MADIKQAAKWINEEKKVRRPDFIGDFYYKGTGRKNTILAGDGASMDDEGFNTEDLLADDWEIFEWVN